MTALICLGQPPEPGCGAVLTEDEIKYYGSCCEACERGWNDRIEAWRGGGADIELDAMFTVPADRSH
jgi:hypothetical protein